MRLGALAALVIVLASLACGRPGSFFQQYEYEEEVYVSLDGTATVYIHSSIPALNALHGSSFDTSPAASIDRDAIAEYFSSPAAHVTWVRPSRRSGRRFAHLRLEVPDIKRLSDLAPLAWSKYWFEKDGDQYVYHQVVGAAVNKDVGDVGWTGKEIVAFRLHLPSRIRFHNSGADIGRGNILAWEQPLADRLRGVPVNIEARMDPESILYRTLWLFAATFVAVAITFGLVIWWVVRRPTVAPAEVHQP
jgi:hypothetical protein